MIMEAVNIAELKNNLSLYLKKVRAGEEIIVRDRNVPVARIVPWQTEHDDELLVLASQGLVRLGNGHIDDQFWQMPAPRISQQTLNAAVLAERLDD
jgi:prevent-host-death family protein